MSEILADVAEEGRRLAVAAREQGVSLRLLGGVAVWCTCPSAHQPPLRRSYGDADFLGRSRERKQITALLESQGYEADRMFNALHGANRLNFHDPVRDRPLDVLLDRFTMAHELDLSESVASDGLTIALADLLMTKLQVVSINEKDVRDILSIAIDHDFGPNGIDLPRILEATRNDWGLEHTFHRSLQTAAQTATTLGLGEEGIALVQQRLGSLAEALTAAPKGVKWKMRARVGERVKWYEEPEEARE